MTSYSGPNDTAPPTEARPEPSALDAALLPLVVLGALLRRLVRAIVLVLIWVFDLAFPVVLQLVRLPLAGARVLGDGIAFLIRGALVWLPVADGTREQWRALVRKRWLWLRRRLSYRAFEHAVHAAFERGMAWVFRRCKNLSPRSAVLVIVAALLWIPISFGAATALHAFLFAKAAVLPPWAQLLHPLATVAAKSKLLVLPVYPAAWPQAKKHGLVLGSFAAFAYLRDLRAWRRFVQLDAYVGAALDRLLSSAGWTAPARFLSAIRVRLDRALSRASGPEKFSEKVDAAVRRWSIKFTPEYYEARELRANGLPASPGVQ